MPRPPALGDLAAAAHAFEADLQALEEAVADGAKVHLNTRKGLERLARDVSRAAELHDRLHQRVTELATRLSASQARMVEAGTRLIAIGTELGGRQTAYTTLLAAYDTLLADAAGVTDLARQGPDALDVLRERLRALVDRAHTLEEEARAAGFRDLREEASARHQQLLALANKLGGVEV